MGFVVLLHMSWAQTVIWASSSNWRDVYLAGRRKRLDESSGGHTFFLPIPRFPPLRPSMAATVLSMHSPLMLFHHKSRMTSSADGTVSLSNLKKRSVICFSSNKKKNIGFMDQILDYIEGGPKLRKWYGAAEILPKDGSISEEDDQFEEKDEVRDAILVTDGDDDIGQMVILSLIVKRTRVRALVKNKRTAVESFGTYVESMAGEVNDRSFRKKALRGVSAIICPNAGFLSSISPDSLKGVQHIILLSQLSVYKGSGGIGAIINSNAAKLAEKEESLLISSGISYTIIRAGSLKNVPGGKQGFSFQEGSAERGTLSKEDAAFISVEALNAVPKKGLVFEVANGEETISNWKEFFTTLMEKADQQM